MLGKRIINILLRQKTAQLYYARNIPKRNFAQVGIAICTPPRIPCSYGEKLLHILFMYVIWLSPMAYFLTQIKVWRREYVES